MKNIQFYVLRKRNLIIFLLTAIVLIAAICFLSIFVFGESFVDPAADADMLLRETFTDQQMTSGAASVTNPIWKTDNSSPNIQSSETNRWLLCNHDASYYIAGDRGWTDYSASVALTFTSDTVIGQENRFSFLIRHTDFAQYGFHDYVVTLKDGNTVSIGVRSFVGSRIAEEKVFTSAALSYLADLGTEHILKVEAMDNVITVFWDSNQVLSYTDTGTFEGTVYDIKTKGCIGFFTKNCAVRIDDIIVRKLEDAFGGDYDNAIGGNFDSAIPPYIVNYQNRNWLY